MNASAIFGEEEQFLTLVGAFYIYIFPFREFNFLTLPLRTNFTLIDQISSLKGLRTVDFFILGFSPPKQIFHYDVFYFRFPMASGALQRTAIAGFSSLSWILSFIVSPKSATLAWRCWSRSTFLYRDDLKRSKKCC